MPIKNLALIASLFALGCGEKSDEERLDDLVAACETFNQAYNQIASTCDAIDLAYFECEESRNKIEENGCIEKGEAAFDCMDAIGYESLECNDESLEAVANCEDVGTAFYECIGE